MWAPRRLRSAIYSIGEGMADGRARPARRSDFWTACRQSTRNVVELNQEVLAIQGPPGSGKTYTGGQMICDLVAAGKKVGVTATSHKVIRNLLDAAAKEAPTRKRAVRLAHKVKIEEAEEDDGGEIERGSMLGATTRRSRL